MSLKRFRERNSRSVDKNVNKPGSGVGDRIKGRLLYEAVVLEFFSNPEVDLQTILPGEGQTDTVLKRYSEGESKVSHPENLVLMPRGSIIAQVVSDKEGWGGTPEIFYPMFPHLLCPVKPGEKIWVIYETLNRARSARGHWLCRIAAPLKVDDLNYTHKDRESLYSLSPPSTNSAILAHGENKSQEVPESSIFGFPPGGGVQESSQTFGKEADAYNKIVQNSISYSSQFSGQPVPRFPPGMGDLVLQGSNNTLISLGVDLSFNANTGSISTMSGSIDMVSGRGMTSLTSAVSNKLIETRGNNLPAYNEINKFPEYGEDPKTSNILEGYADFLNDASRVLVAMNTNGDANFQLDFTNEMAPPVEKSPFVIAKSTEVRLVARDGGSVRMVKEGESQCEICLMSDGSISIEGGTIYLGENSGGNTSQPVVLGKLLEKACHNFADTMQSALTAPCGNLQQPLITSGIIAGACLTFKTEVTEALSLLVYTK